MPKNPWPRQVASYEVQKVFGPDGSPVFEWFVSSHSTPGAWRRVLYHASGVVRWWTCSCPAGRYNEAKMGTQFERMCAHVRAVFQAESDDGLAARPAVPPNVAALTE